MTTTVFPPSQIRFNLPAASLIVQYNLETENLLKRLGQLISAAAAGHLSLLGVLPIDQLVYSLWTIPLSRLSISPAVAAPKRGFSIFHGKNVLVAVLGI